MSSYICLAFDTQNFLPSAKSSSLLSNKFLSAKGIWMHILRVKIHLFNILLYYGYCVKVYLKFKFQVCVIVWQLQYSKKLCFLF